jgi:isocitrate lyase
MDLTLTLTGFCCDLALHPVDTETAARVCALGEDLYKTNSIEWWRANTNNTCGMRLAADSLLEVTVDGAPVRLNPARIATAASLITQRAFLDSPESQLCLLGYDDEACSRTWTWKNVTHYDPALFQFFVQRWDRILGVPDYLVLDDVCYDGRIANAAEWGQSRGFSFREPLVVAMDAVRAAFGTATKKAA